MLSPFYQHVRNVRPANITSQSEQHVQLEQGVRGIGKKWSAYLLQPLSVVFHHMLQALQFLGREILVHVGGIPLESVRVVLVGGAFTTVPILFWKDERVGALSMLNPVISSGTGLWTPAWIAAA